MKVPYRCIYNHELLILATSQTPYASYQDPVTDAQTIGLVKELEGTGVDALMICPQAWMTNLWRSQIDRRWEEIAPLEKEPLPEANVKYPTRAYFRIRRYMLEGKDPVALTIQTARKCGIAPFLSYRMNEHHYTNNPDASTHSKFWKEHQHFMLESEGSNLNYLEPEVQSYYFSLISELLDLYDVEGFECDFMRFPKYFPSDHVEEGLEAMTALVRKIRAKLDEVGDRRGHRLSFSVRVPRSLAHAREIGLDVARWDREGLIDMVNASSMFRISQEVDIEGFRSKVRNSSLYGEMHFVSQAGEGPGGYWVNINRLTAPELYQSTALSYLDRGADGVSLFNFAYTRDHSFNEPRRSYYPGVEPPFHVLPFLASKEKLKGTSQLIALTPDFGSLPRSIKGRHDTTFRIHVGDCFAAGFAGAILRIEADSYISHRPFEAWINERPAGLPVPLAGELFPPISLEAMPDPRKLIHFPFDPTFLKPGYNEIRIANNWVTSGGGGYRGSVRLQRLELALYRTVSGEFKSRILRD